MPFYFRKECPLNSGYLRDPQLGCPTRETLQRLGLEDIAADLAAHNLLPA
ncbi:uncharacterized protein ydhV [Shigella dysenteriae 1617]|uniref:Tungsten-containing aldehyde ferredoxin oxidoreductase n=2 Tax=Shigella dysenteriae TaxID=622 RepID=E2XFZ7_SHIDY|nr:hypothetical protein [Shigella dysenteriae]AHA65386.1 Tungsten-containing aldehyde ferredoxin oxidoreductase [Shigella dysenteriae 1617]EFP69237.1 uncharacterized protein ydhV [Shigella dysenteriae 1617]WNT50906.1 hypothetical protein PWP84_22650 [Shigella dysenteriae]